MPLTPYIEGNQIPLDANDKQPSPDIDDIRRLRSLSSSTQQAVHMPTQFCQRVSRNQDAYTISIVRSQSARLCGATQGTLSAAKSCTDGSFLHSLQDTLSWRTITSDLGHNLICLDTIQQSVRHGPDTLVVEAIGYAIRAGNDDLLEGLFDNNPNLDPGKLSLMAPFHLAASFLDGANGCCKALSILAKYAGPSVSHRDQYGQTILDALMVNILRSHSSVAPQLVSEYFIKTGRFPGEEKDICGRWDADSFAVETLFKSGSARVPNNWKHPFCHASVQAICHAMDKSYSQTATSHTVNDPSGLFVRQCQNCGLELKLQPLHVLAVVAFYLGQNGMAGETLFGILAVFVHLVQLGVAPCSQANVSLVDIVTIPEAGMCHHSLVTADEMMASIPNDMFEDWDWGRQVGWRCFQMLIQLAQIESVERQCRLSAGQHINMKESANTCTASYFAWDGTTPQVRFQGRLLCTFSATIHCEVMTFYRTVSHAPWLSESFSMQRLHGFLEEEMALYRQIGETYGDRMFTVHVVPCSSGCPPS
jgi:hypothetical protein